MYHLKNLKLKPNMKNFFLEIIKDGKTNNRYRNNIWKIKIFNKSLKIQIKDYCHKLEDNSFRMQNYNINNCLMGIIRII